MALDIVKECWRKFRGSRFGSTQAVTEKNDIKLMPQRQNTGLHEPIEHYRKPICKQIIQ